MSTYSQEFQEKMVAKLLPPNSKSVLQLSEESGVSKSALYKWLNNFKQQEPSVQGKEVMQQQKQLDKNAVPIRPQNWSAESKLSAINTTSSMTDEEIGAYCRKNGIYSNHLVEWRQLLVEGLKPSVNKEQRQENIKLKARVKRLESELNRKDRALAETSALLILKKKANLIWGEEKEG